uniref:Uncharacterized protein n=1 Tax=Quercus lobata TaxID=97700 RepID=A0A7N2LFS7_QUELO
MIFLLKSLDLDVWLYSHQEKVWLKYSQCLILYASVCGNAHCALAPYWSKKLGKCDFVAYQASSRSGVLNIHLDEQNQRVLLQGKAVTVMEGSLLV